MFKLLLVVNFLFGMWFLGCGALFLVMVLKTPQLQKKPAVKPKSTALKNLQNTAFRYLQHTVVKCTTAFVGLGVFWVFLVGVLRLVVKKLYAFVMTEQLVEQTLGYGILLVAVFVISMGLLIQFNKITWKGVVRLVVWTMIGSYFTFWAATVGLVVISELVLTSDVFKWGGLTVRKIYWSVDQLIRVGEFRVREAGLTRCKISICDLAVNANHNYDNFVLLLDEEVKKAKLSKGAVV